MQYELKTELLGGDLSKGIALAAFEGLTELDVDRLFEESIITAKLRDVLPVEQRGPWWGQTVTGARVYNSDAPLGDKLARSFAHIYGRT
jgi:hypothetical protein